MSEPKLNGARRQTELLMSAIAQGIGLQPHGQQQQSETNQPRQNQSDLLRCGRWEKPSVFREEGFMTGAEMYTDRTDQQEGGVPQPGSPYE